MASSPESPALPGHIPRIDVLRGWAILMVFSIHGALGLLGLVLWKGFFRNYAQSGDYSNNDGLVPLTCGWAGVALFFVISGFCIHYGFLCQPAWQAKNFFWKRFVRLYPAYFVSLLFFIFWNYAQNPSQVTAGGVVSHLFLVHNLSRENFGSINGVYWSLGVECQFYLLYPILLWGRQKYGLPCCMAFSLALNIFSYGFISLLGYRAEFPIDPVIGFPLMTWCDWILGACVAEAFVTGRACFTHQRFFWFLTLSLFILAINFRPLIGQAFLFASVGFAVLLQDYIAVREPLNWREKCLVPLGLVSYSFYLWHGPLVDSLRLFLLRLIQLPKHSSVGSIAFFCFPIILVILLGISGISYYLLEVLPRRFFYRSFQKSERKNQFRHHAL